MTRIFTPLVTVNIDNSKYVALHEPFVFESDVLKNAGLKYHIEGPIGFVYDFESIPWIRGTNKRGGTAHDIVCRKNVVPGITKAIAAAVYFEIMEYCYAIDCQRDQTQKVIDWGRRWFKWAVVYVWPGYFQKYELMATCEEISGLKGDPYVTAEKIEAAIVQSEEATASIKDIPEQVEQKADLVQASEQVTSDLKDAKADVK
jgi:hypothetical protein